MEISCETDLMGVLDLVHDRWFNIDQVKFDKEYGVVTIFLGENRKDPLTEKVLKIDGVLDIKIKDEAHIGIYDLCEIVPEYSSATLRITSGFPMEIMLSVKERCAISVTSLKERGFSG